MIKKILIGLAGVIVVLILAGFLLPTATVVDNTVVITAPARYVFEEMNGLKNWPRWSYWNSIDPDMKTTYSDPSLGTGAHYTWDGAHTGKGKLTITASEPDRWLACSVAFSESGAGIATHKLEPGPDGVTLISNFTYEHGMNVISRWMGFVFISREVSKAMDYEGTKLKEIAEAKPKFSVSITEVEVPAISYIGMAHTMNTNDQAVIGEQMIRLYGELMSALTRTRVEMPGRPYCFYPRLDETGMDLIASVPVPANAKLPAKYKVMQTTGGPAVKAIHQGDYNSLTSTHSQLNQYITWRKLEINGAPWEVYITDPEVEKDTAKWVTEVYYPVRK